jgi:hypothetical protein
VPVAKSRRSPGRQALWLGLAAALGVAAMILLVVWVGGQARRGEVSVRIGDDTFRPGQAATIADFIADEGPWLVPDVAGGDRDLILQHLGDDPTSGWYAFAARPLQAPRDCLVQWQQATETFVDSCDGTVYPADGEGLPRFPVRIDDGELEVIVTPANVGGNREG